MMAFKAEQDTEQMFRDAQGDNLPPYSQDFFDYLFSYLLIACNVFCRPMATSLSDLSKSKVP